MSVFVKYEIFPFHNDTIKNVSVQNFGNTMAFCSGQQDDTLKMVQLTLHESYADKNVRQKIDFKPLELKNLHKKNMNILCWSPNDGFLATACDRVQVWMVQQDQIVKYQDQNDHSLEVTALSWSPDSSRLASAALDGKIVVRQVPTNTKIMELPSQHKVLGLKWDPFDKYLVALYADNAVRIWKVNTWELVSTISLNFPLNTETAKITSKREDRKIDWSPDQRQVLVPSLDDKVVPVVCAMDRQQNFKVTTTFMGPFSSINCVKFSPVLQKNGNNIISVFAMGDNDGNISVWGIGNDYERKKPFFLFKSHSNGNELIEDISWSSDGKVLLASTMKKQMFVAMFEEKLFGRRLSVDEHTSYLKEMQGSVRTIMGTQSQGGGALQTNRFKAQRSGANEAPATSQQTLESRIGANTSQSFGAAQQNENKVNLTQIFTQQKTIEQGGKKRIIPSMQVVKKADAPVDETNKENIKNNPNNSMVDEKPNAQNEPNINASANTNTNANPRAQVTNNLVESQTLVNSGSREVPINISSDIRMGPIMPNIAGGGSLEHRMGGGAANGTTATSFSSTNNTNNQGNYNNNSQNNTNQNTNSQNADNRMQVEPNGLKAQSSVDSKTTPTNMLLEGLNKKDPKGLKLNKKESKKPQLNDYFGESQRQRLNPPSPLPESQIQKLSNGRVLECQAVKSGEDSHNTQIRCSALRNNRKEIMWTDYVEGRLVLIEHCPNFLCQQTNKNLLYIDTEHGKRQEVPFIVPNLVWMRLNKAKDLLTLREDGELKVQNLDRRETTANENILFLIKENTPQTHHGINSPAERDVIEQVHLDESGVPILLFKNSLIQFQSAEAKGWQRLDNSSFELGQLGNVGKGDQMVSSTIRSKSIATNESFFDKLIIQEDDAALRSQLFNDYSLMPKQEERLLQLIKYGQQDSAEPVLELSAKYLKLVCQMKEVNKVRQLFIDMFANTSSREGGFLSRHKVDRKKLFQGFKAILDEFPYLQDLATELNDIIGMIE